MLAARARQAEPRAVRDGRTRAEDLQSRLAKAIVSGVYLPGARLDEQSLADRFGVSRTPVREALKQLAVTGLVELRRHRGATVASITPESLGHLFETMAELEALCAGFAAERMGKAAKRRLAAMLEAAEKLVAADDPAAYSLHNLDFHGAIYAGGGNPHLAETTVAVRTRLAPFRGAQFRIPERLGLSQMEHRAVVQAILDGRRDAAAEAMRRHLLTVRDAAMRYSRPANVPR
jgi:DNA-binding GntR family transcriptional regulator